MEQDVFATHQRLAAFPPAKLVYIIVRRLREQGLSSTWLWVWDKLVSLTQGVSPKSVSQVQPLLFVGGQHRRRGLSRMRAWGIGAVVNLRAESDDAARGIAPEHYLWLPTVDDAVPSLAELQRGVDFITAQIAAGRGVYIHCAAGVGRAPLLAAAYLVSTGMKPDEAWAAIRARRVFVRPTPPQTALLEQFSRSLA
ncbi:MAG TPA: dual specificity protein phosphatase family protein [Anaerolineae bacterium]|nr:dual specificity protein phosphatase family protein [Anaerolineae bacterium]